MTASQSFSSNSVRTSISCTSNMNAPMAFAWASRAVFVARSCSSCTFAFSYRSTRLLYRAVYSCWFCDDCAFSEMQRRVSSVTTSTSVSRRSISASMPVQSVSVVCIRRQSARMPSLPSRTALKASTNRALMVFSSRWGVSHLLPPLNLLLHCQMTRRYLLLELHTLGP